MTEANAPGGSGAGGSWARGSGGRGFAADRLVEGRPRTGRLGWRGYTLLALAALAFFLPGRARLPPVDRDEARYLQATRQMLASGDYVQIRFQDQPRNLQPVGVYWLEALAAKAFGGRDARAVWAYRIPSLIGATGAVLLTAWIGETLFGTQAGVAAALLMAFSALLGFESRMAKIDACLLATTLLAQGTLLRAYLGRIAGAGRANAAIFWAAIGAGLLLKGPIILIVSGSTVAGLAILERGAGWARRLHPSWGWLIPLAIALPWFAVIGFETHGAFFAKAVGQNLLGKVGRGEQAHGLPPGYYLLMFNLSFWPGSLAAVYALPWAWRQRTQPAIRFLAAWIAPTWALYEIIGTKLPHYVLPLYPALACLGAGAATAVKGWRPGWGGAWPARAYAALWMAVALALAAAGPWLLWRYEHRLDAVALCAALICALAAGGALASLAINRRALALGLAGLAAWSLFSGLYAWSLPEASALWLSPRIAALAARVRPCPQSVLASTRFAEPSLVFLEPGPVREIAVKDAADLLAHDPRCAMALVDKTQLAAFQGRLAQDGAAVEPIGQVRGVNYSRGKTLELTLFRASAFRAPARPRAR